MWQTNRYGDVKYILMGYIISNYALSTLVRIHTDMFGHYQPHVGQKSKVGLTNESSMVSQSLTKTVFSVLHIHTFRPKFD